MLSNLQSDRYSTTPKRSSGATASARLASNLALAVTLASGIALPAQDAARDERVAPSKRPNLVFVLADDLGWSHVGFMGAKFFETPYLDSLAKDGMIFDRAYTCGPNCAPTRASLISGMYGPRHHIYTPGAFAKGPIAKMKLLVPSRRNRKVAFPPTKTVLAPKVVSIAEVLKSAGYKTAHFGKWHLGPDSQGFDVSSSDGTPGKRGRHYGNINVAEKLTDASLEWIEKNKGEPFFLYLSHWDVHTPIRARPHVVAKYEKKAKDAGSKANATYAAMIEAVDTSVGRLRSKLAKLGLAENTLFVFSSDNGGLPSVATNAPLFAGKGSLFEGGIRVPTCMTWPAKIAKGSRCDVPITSVDFLPSFAELAGADLPKEQPIDGVSFVPLLHGQRDKFAERSIYWFYPLYLRGGRAATRYCRLRGPRTTVVFGVAYPPQSSCAAATS